jgi:hypothetical protein
MAYRLAARIVLLILPLHFTAFRKRETGAAALILPSFNLFANPKGEAH